MIVILDRYGFPLEVGIYCNRRYGNNNTKTRKPHTNHFLLFETQSAKAQAQREEKYVAEELCYKFGERW